MNGSHCHHHLEHEWPSRRWSHSPGVSFALLPPDQTHMGGQLETPNVLSSESGMSGLSLEPFHVSTLPPTVSEPVLVSAGPVPAAHRPTSPHWFSCPALPVRSSLYRSGAGTEEPNGALNPKHSGSLDTRPCFRLRQAVCLWQKEREIWYLKKRVTYCL